MESVLLFLSSYYSVFLPPKACSTQWDIMCLNPASFVTYRMVLRFHRDMLIQSQLHCHPSLRVVGLWIALLFLCWAPTLLSPQLSGPWEDAMLATLRL